MNVNGMPKVYIEYQFREGPYGGANQSLKNVRDFLLERNLYTDNPIDADFILINHTNISKEVFNLKRRYPNKIYVHRMDGPVSKHRKHSKILDKQSFFLDKILCEGTIFQSEWTEKNCFELGYQQTGRIAIIHNAVNKSIFNKDVKKQVVEKNKIKLVSSSWSANWNKGFDYIKYLDEKLDFDKYEYTFIGNSPVEFKNIKHISPLASNQLADELKQHDIYLATSKNESCSNSLLEAMACGLPVVARNSGCYQELVKQGGEIAEGMEEFPNLIDKVAANKEQYAEKIEVTGIEEMGKKYYDFMSSLLGQNSYKKVTFWQENIWKIYVLYIKAYQKIESICRKVRWERKYEPY